MSNIDSQHDYHPFRQSFLTNEAAIIALAANATELNALAAAAPAAALTAQLTTITCSSPGTPDYAIADLTATSPYGFASADEGQTVLKVIANLQIRLAEVEARLKTTLALIS